MVFSADDKVLIKRLDKSGTENVLFHEANGNLPMPNNPHTVLLLPYVGLYAYARHVVNLKPRLGVCRVRRSSCINSQAQ